MFAFLVNISLKARLLVLMTFAVGMVYGGVSLSELRVCSGGSSPRSSRGCSRWS